MSEKNFQVFFAHPFLNKRLAKVAAKENPIEME